jgi:hypothetical protein
VSDADCDDEDPCSADACEAGACAFTVEPGCTSCLAGCLSSEPCVSATCDLPSLTCKEEPLDCDDGEPCTTDACDAATGDCTYEPVPGCSP